MKTALALLVAGSVIAAATVGADIGVRAADARELQAAIGECSTDAECAALPMCALKPGCDGGPYSEPFRLVGLGCKGATGPLYRDEEDEFPAGGCRVIEATWEG